MLFFLNFFVLGRCLSAPKTYWPFLSRTRLEAKEIYMTRKWNSVEMTTKLFLKMGGWVMLSLAIQEPGILICRCRRRGHGREWCCEQQQKVPPSNSHMCNSQMEPNTVMVDRSPRGRPGWLLCWAHWRWPSTWLGRRILWSTGPQRRRNPTWNA